MLGYAVMSALVATSTALAYEEDVHYDVTFALAAALGMNWEQARVVASAAQAIDENRFTEPTLVVGQYYVKLSLQDFAFHCFSPEPDKPGQRNAKVLDNMQALEGKALQRIKESLRTNSEQDKLRALIAIGVYLHCQQDSWSHSGYGATHTGHSFDNFIGTSPDQTARYVELTKSALAETADKLRQFIVAMDLRPKDISQENLNELSAGMTEYGPHAPAINVPQRPACNRKITERWLYKNAGGEHSHIPAETRSAQTYTFTFSTKVTDITIDLENTLPKGDNLDFSSDLVNLFCEMLFRRVFPEVRTAYTDSLKFEGVGPANLMIEWVKPLTISFLRLPEKRIPYLKPNITAEPTFTDFADSYNLLKK